MTPLARGSSSCSKGHISSSSSSKQPLPIIHVQRPGAFAWNPHPNCYSNQPCRLGSLTHGRLPAAAAAAAAGAQPETAATAAAAAAPREPLIRLTKRKRPLSWPKWEKNLFEQLLQADQEQVGQPPLLAYLEPLPCPGTNHHKCCMMHDCRHSWPHLTAMSGTIGEI